VVWVLRDALPEESEGRHGAKIHLTDQYSCPRRRGWIVATGPESSDLPLGDYVLFDRHFVRPDNLEDEYRVNGIKVVAVDRPEIWAAALPGKEGLRLHPVDDVIVVALDEAVEKSRGGVYLPNADTPEGRVGTIVSVGSGRRMRPKSDPTTIRTLPVRLVVGDRVFLDNLSFFGVRTSMHGQEIVFVREREILAIVEEEAA